MTAWYVFETLTGEILQEFTPLKGSWEARLNEAETLNVTISLDDEENLRMGWRFLCKRWAHGILVEEQGRLFAGVITDFVPDSRLQIVAKGIKAIFDKRTILPPSALTGSLLRPDGEPNEAMNTILDGYDFGTIGSKLVQQACKFPASNFPIRFHQDRRGSRRRAYAALDFKPVGDALSDITNVINGAEFRFTPKWVDGSSTKIFWDFESGTEEKNKLISTNIEHFDVEAEGFIGSDLEIDSAGGGESLVWASTGGGEKTLVSRAYDDTHVAEKIPLLELVDSSHTTVSVQSTLDSHARTALLQASRDEGFWRLKISLQGFLKLSSLQVGDLCDVTVTTHPIVPSGTYRRRILEMKGDESGLWVELNLGGFFDG